MVDPTSMHSITTSLPDGLWRRFEEERKSEDRNIAQHLRVVVKRYFEHVDSQQERSPWTAPEEVSGTFPGRHYTVASDD